MSSNVLETEAELTELLAATKRIAVLGIKTADQADEPAFYVAKYLVDSGFDVVPVPVYYPEATEILGRSVVRQVADVAPRVDMVNVFRRSRDLAAHLGRSPEGEAEQRVAPARHQGRGLRRGARQGGHQGGAGSLLDGGAAEPALSAESGRA